jgi:hypothetical protein
VWQIIVGGSLAGVFALIGAALGSMNEKRKWLRDARREAYMSFADSGHTAYVYARGGALPVDLTKSMFTAQTAVALLGPKRVDVAARAFADYLQGGGTERSQVNDLYESFISEASRALTSKRIRGGMTP